LFAFAHIMVIRLPLRATVSSRSILTHHPRIDIGRAFFSR
jgi:hypothetical protein